jgi:dehydrogenase/reductase SDR family protein 1
MIGSFGGLSYAFNVAYGVAKAGLDRLAKDMAVELTKENISVISLWPGVVMTERNRRSIDSGEWQKHIGLPLEHVESPALTGKVVVELALDGNNMQKTGTYQVVAELAHDYHITHADGMPTPPSIRSLQFLLPAYAMDENLRKRIPNWLIPDWKLPFWLMTLGRPDTKSK